MNGGPIILIHHLRRFFYFCNGGPISKVPLMNIWSEATTWMFICLSLSWSNIEKNCTTMRKRGAIVMKFILRKSLSLWTNVFKEAKILVFPYNMSHSAANIMKRRKYDWDPSSSLMKVHCFLSVKVKCSFYVLWHTVFFPLLIKLWVLR